MKYLITLFVILASLQASAQDTIHIPTRVAKQIAKDLVNCDSLKAVHELTTNQLTLTEQKVSLKDSIITTYIKKDSLYEERIKNCDGIVGIQKEYIKDFTKKNKKLKVKLLFTKVTLGVVIGGLTYLYITK